MIFYLVTANNRHYTINRFLLSWGKTLKKIIQPIDYNRFFKKSNLLPGIYIFSDIELLDNNERNQAAHMWEQLKKDSNCILLNHPQQSQMRYELLRSSYNQNQNQFNVYRTDDDWQSIRFPVFIRIENDHLGKRSELIHSKDELDTNIKNLMSEGFNKKNLLIIEFCKTADNSGIYRKYSSFIVGNEIIPRHVFFSQDWHLKHDDLYNDTFFQEEMDYMQNNPHKDELKLIFQAANIQYGRIDYSLLNGKIQIWEINTNPVSLSPDTPTKTLRSKVHNTFAEQYCNAWEDLFKKYKGKSVNYSEEQFRLHFDLFKSTSLAQRCRRTIHKTKAKIANACPSSLKLYKHLKGCQKTS